MFYKILHDFSMTIYYKRFANSTTKFSCKCFVNVLSGAAFFIIMVVIRIHRIWPSSSKEVMTNLSFVNLFSFLDSQS